MGMDEKVDEVLKQYELDIKAKRRVRGSVVVESGDEFYVVKPYLRDEMRILFEESVKECLYKNGYEFADFALKNNSEKYISEDSCGGKWVIRRWFQAQDCDVRDKSEVRMAAGHLAYLHRCMRLSDESEAKFNTSRIDIVSLFKKHNNEMKRVNSYIKAKKQLMERFSLSEPQANSIVEMRLRALTGLEREKLENEYVLSQSCNI